MRTFKLILILTIATLNCVGQDSESWKVRYFINLKGSTWHSSKEINDSTILKMDGIGLSLWTLHDDSLRKDVTLWIFNDDLTIKYYNAATKKDSVILTCDYEHDENLNLLKIVLRDKDKTTLTYRHVAVSNGGYVGLTRQKKKGKKNNNRQKKL